MIINQMKEDLFNGRQSITNYPLFLIIIIIFLIKNKRYKKKRKRFSFQLGNATKCPLATGRY